jgi:hypothetical protein
MSSDELLLILCTLETELLGPAARKDAKRLDEILHRDFIEFGRSGSTYTRAVIVDSLPREKMKSVHAHDFRAELLARNVALLTYKSAEKLSDGSFDKYALRASVWKRGISGWQIVFHQGTPTAAFTVRSQPC